MAVNDVITNATSNVKVKYYYKKYTVKKKKKYDCNIYFIRKR